MKKYKIGNRIITAGSPVEAVKVSKILDSATKEIEYLTKEEERAVDDYRKAIAGTTNPKLLELYKHILDEELEHIRELENADVEDCDMKDERLSPMTYKKLKELGVSNKQWAGWTQEQANAYIRNKSGKKTSEKSSEKISSSESLKKIKSIASVTNVSNKKQAEDIVNALVEADAKTYDDVKSVAKKINSKLDGVDIYEIAQIYLDTDDPFEKKEKKFEPRDRYEADAIEQVRRTLLYEDNIKSTLEETQKDAYDTYEMTYGAEPDEKAKAEINRLAKNAYDENRN